MPLVDATPVHAATTCGALSRCVAVAWFVTGATSTTAGASAVSYFDKLWNERAKTARYHLVLHRKD
jgi:hypothetical protein